MKRKLKTTILVGAMAGVVAVGGIMAYFTDGDTATNTFTVGKISIDLQEPDWEPPEDITPEQEFDKNPQIKNDGLNDEYVFATVAVPYKNLVTANADGTKNAAADTELFSYTVNTGWVELGTPSKDTVAGTITHTYAYGTDSAMTALAKNATTPTLFDKVKFANIVEDQNLEGTSLDIVINAYAIQTGNINGGKTAPADVWSVLMNQLPTTDVGVSEDVNTDIKN